MAIYMWREQTIYDGMLGYRPLQTDNSDISGNNNNVTITGCSFGTVGGKSGIRLSTSYTDSPSNYITTPDIGKHTTFSYAGWLYKTTNDTSGSSDWTSFFDNATSDTTNAIRLRCKYKITRSTVNGNTNTDAEGYTITTNTRTHYCITSDGTTAKVYINGEYYNSFTSGTDTSNSSGVYYMGRGYGWVNGGTVYRRSRPGWLRHCAFWDRVLSAEEVQEFYTLTA